MCKTPPKRIGVRGGRVGGSRGGQAPSCPSMRVGVRPGVHPSRMPACLMSRKPAGLTPRMPTLLISRMPALRVERRRNHRPCLYATFPPPQHLLQYRPWVLLFPDGPSRPHLPSSLPLALPPHPLSFFPPPYHSLFFLLLLPSATELFDVLASESPERSMSLGC